MKLYQSGLFALVFLPVCIAHVSSTQKDINAVEAGVTPALQDSSLKSLGLQKTHSTGFMNLLVNFFSPAKEVSSSFSFASTRFARLVTRSGYYQSSINRVSVIFPTDRGEKKLLRAPPHTRSMRDDCFVGPISLSVCDCEFW